MNIGAPWPDPMVAEFRVLEMQTKLHQWAMADPGRCFDDLFNLVYDPAFLAVAWAPEPVKPDETTCHADLMSASAVGSLIQATVGSFGGWGRRCPNRAGLVA